MPGKHASTPQQARSVRTRERLLEAAAAVVSTDGVSALTLDRVAEVAGVSKGGLLYHFATKRELVVAMLGRTLGRADDALADLAGDDGRPGAFAHAYLDYVRSVYPSRMPASPMAAWRALPNALQPLNQTLSENSSQPM